MNHIRITEDPLVVEEIVKQVTHPTAGGISLFIGTTRDNFNGKKVVQLEYESYTPMALKEMKKICDDIRQNWPSVVNIVMLHRIGKVPICEASVVIATSSPHREVCHSATQHGIDTLKATVPIWKKEIYEDKTSSWKENCECSGK